LSVEIFVTNVLPSHHDCAILVVESEVSSVSETSP